MVPISTRMLETLSYFTMSKRVIKPYSYPLRVSLYVTFLISFRGLLTSFLQLRNRLPVQVPTGFDYLGRHHHLRMGCHIMVQYHVDTDTTNTFRMMWRDNAKSCDMNKELCRVATYVIFHMVNIIESVSLVFVVHSCVLVVQVQNDARLGCCL